MVRCSAVSFTPRQDASGQRWIDQDLGDGWVASFRLGFAGGDFTIDELHVRTTPERAALAELHDETRVLSARRMRDVRFTGATRAAGKLLRQQIADLARVGGDPAQVERHLAAQRLARRRARPRPSDGHSTHKPDRWYVEVAGSYADKCRRGVRNPVEEVAEEYGYSPARIRQAITHARDQGWLTPTTRGRAGGALTDAALAIVTVSKSGASVSRRSAGGRRD